MSHYLPPTHEHDPDPLEGRAALIKGNPTFGDVTNSVLTPVESPHRNWWLFFIPAAGLLGVLGLSVAWLIWTGVGVWGNNVPVGWGWPIVNFVFWVGIGHAGTLISAVLFLFRQKWRTSINRASEAMTIFAVICALLFPGIHVGRIWAAYWMPPIPNQMQLWPNFRSPLIWDVFAVSTYFTVSLLFWYVGLIPDLATLRDRAKSKIRRMAYGAFALGWRGSARHWVNYEAAYLLLAAMATPLVLSVHSIVSFDFAVSQLPGWHTTIFPPYFVAGAIFSGFGMVLTLIIPIRVWFKLEHIITIKHLENMAKIILLTGSIVGYAYGLEFFIAWYSGNPYESFLFVNRAFGDYSWAYWIMLTCNVATPQLIWSRRIRRSPGILFIMSIFVNIGMWFERFVIVASSLHHDFLPSSWAYFTPKLLDWTTFLGSFGLFFTLFCLFARYLPMVAMAEAKSVMPQASPHYHDPSRKPPPRRSLDSSSGVTSGQVDSRHDFDSEDPPPAAVKSEQSLSGSAKVVVSSGLSSSSGDAAEDEDKPTAEDEADAEDKVDAASEEAADADPEALTRPLSEDEDVSSKEAERKAEALAEEDKKSSGDFTFAAPSKPSDSAGDGNDDDAKEEDDG